ncbi:MAG: hypothetical protein ABFD96_21290 [Armatimonadia bacterium]
MRGVKRSATRATKDFLAWTEGASAGICPCLKAQQLTVEEVEELEELAAKGIRTTEPAWVVYARKLGDLPAAPTTTK